MDKKVRLEPGYYEWHLVDEDDKILLNITDSDIDSRCNTAKELLEVIDVIWDDASEQVISCGEFNGIKQDYLDDDWKFVVAKRLFEHFGYDTKFLERVEKFRDKALSCGFCLQDLGISDWYDLLEIALNS